MDIANLIIPGVVTPVDHPPPVTSNLPSADELLASVSDFLREEVMEETEGRVQFLSRVAANSLEIVRREAHLGPHFAAAQYDRLQNLLGGDAELVELSWQLVKRLRDETSDLSDDSLKQHLRQTSFEALAIDQPHYHAFITASQQSAI